MSSLQLLSSYKLGPYQLTNRMVMAPLTRCRAGEGHVPTPLMATYYRQRASAGLIITEATQVTPEGIGYPNTPGIHSKEQVAGWTQVTNAVHDAGGKIFLQLWHVGRISHSLYQPNGQLPVAPSAVPMSGEIGTPQGMKPYETPRPLDISEIPGIVEKYRIAAKNAMEAGFHGVEVHGANGYLLDQFLQSGTNKRTDAYGGSVANRARLLLEVVQAVVDVWGTSRVGVRLSPNGTFHDMFDDNAAETFGYVIGELDKLGIAYVHLREGTKADLRRGRQPVPTSVFRSIFKRTLMVNDGYTKERGEAAIESKHADMIVFGTLFLANPDLPKRYELGAELNRPDSATFYGGGEHGYTDYPALSPQGVSGQ